MTLKMTMVKVLAGLGLLTALTGAAMAEELRFSTPAPEPHIFTQTANRIAAALSTDGDTVTVSPSNQLGDIPTVLSLLQSGAVQLAMVPVGDLANRDPAFYGWFLPYQFDDLADAAAATETQPAKDMLARLERQGLVGLGYVFPGQRHVLSGTPLKTPADFRNLKIRAFPNDIFRAWWTELGAAPTALPLPEMMPSLVTGVIDAADVDIDIVWGLRMFEQKPSLTLTNHMAFPGAVLASARWWSGLDPARQDEIRAAVDEAQAWAIETQVAGETALLGKLTEAGTEVTEFDATQLEAAAETVRQQFLDRDPLIRAFHEATKD